MGLGKKFTGRQIVSFPERSEDLEALVVVMPPSCKLTCAPINSNHAGFSGFASSQLGEVQRVEIGVKAFVDMNYVVSSIPSALRGAFFQSTPT